MSIVDEILAENKPPKDVTKLNGVYLEPNIDKILNQLSKRGGRGAKTKIANEAFKMLFRAKGLLD